MTWHALVPLVWVASIFGRVADHRRRPVTARDRRVAAMDRRLRDDFYNRAWDRRVADRRTA